MIEGALLTVNVIMAIIFMAAAALSWIKEQDMQSFAIFMVLRSHMG